MSEVEVRDGVEELVEKAALFLDTLGPGWWSEDWETPVDLTRLAMMSARDCVAGQAFANRKVSSRTCDCCPPSGYDYVLERLSGTGLYDELAPAFALHAAGPVWAALILHRRAVYRQQMPETPVLI